MYDVVWMQEALNDLARIWMQADSVLRQEITRAANALDRELSTNPYLSSESRADDERIIFIYPIGAIISIELGTRTVRILNVWRFHRRRS